MDFDGFRTPLIPTKATQVTMKSGAPVFDLCLEGEMQAHLAAEMGASHMHSGRNPAVSTD